MDRQADSDQLPNSAKLAAALGGALLAAVPTFAAELSGSDFAMGDPWFAMLGLAGLCVLGVGFWFGTTTRQSLGMRVLVRLCGGAAVGTILSVLIVELLYVELSQDTVVVGVFLVAGLVWVFFWLAGSLGIGLGTMTYRFRTSDDQQVRDKIQSGYYEPGGAVSTSSGWKKVLDLEPGDTFTDTTGMVVTATSHPEVATNEVLVAIQTSAGRGLRRWHISQFDGHGTNP